MRKCNTNHNSPCYSDLSVEYKVKHKAFHY